jgi:hypothetical protein
VNVCGSERDKWRAFVNTVLYKNIKITQKMYFNIYYVFYAQCSEQLASVGIPAIFRVFLFFFLLPLAGTL